MIKLPRQIFQNDSLINLKETSRRKIRFLIKPEFLLTDDYIENVISKHMVSVDPIDKCVFCDCLRFLGDKINVEINEEHVIFNCLNYKIEPQICFENFNPNCPKKNFKRNSQEYIRKVYNSIDAESKIKSMSDVGKGRYSEEWFINKYDKEQGLIKFQEYKNNLSKSKTLQGFIDKHGLEEGTIKWNSFIEKQSAPRDEQFFISKYGEEEGKKRYLEFREKKSYTNSKQYYIDQYGQDEANKIIDNKRPNLEKFSEKYGEIEGPILYDEYCKSKVTTLDNMIGRHGEVEGKKKFEEFRDKSKQTLENMIERYGEDDGIKRYEEYREKLKGKCNLEWFIERFGSIDGNIKYSNFCKSSAYTLQKSIEKYGEINGKIRHENFLNKIKHTEYNYIKRFGQVEGLTRYNNYIQKMVNRFLKGYSKISQKLFFKIYENLKYDTIKFAALNGEYFVSKGENFYLLDFFDSSINKCIEFNGDYWHANPKKYKETDYISATHLHAKDIWRRDQERLDFLRKNNIQVLSIWESDYIDNPDKILNECLEFLERK